MKTKYIPQSISIWIICVVLNKDHAKKIPKAIEKFLPVC